MKSITNSILLLMTFSFLVFSCSNGSSPSNVLNQYLDETFKLEYESAYSKLSNEDKSIKSLQEYLAEGIIRKRGGGRSVVYIKRNQE